MRTEDYRSCADSLNAAAVAARNAERILADAANSEPSEHLSLTLQRASQAVCDLQLAMASLVGVERAQLFPQGKADAT